MAPIRVLLLWSSCLLAHATQLAPRLGDGSEVDYWLVFKSNAAVAPNCSTTRTCKFGGFPRIYQPWGLRYLVASSVDGSTKPMTWHDDCLGSGADPVAQTFEQIFDGRAPNYVLWNDQLNRDPQPKVTPPCREYCHAPWAASKGALAWDENGTGFVLQVSTPDWPGTGDRDKKRRRGNTLGCTRSNNVKFSHHFMAMKLSSEGVAHVLRALSVASVVTDPTNSQLMKLTTGPADLQSLASHLGHLNPTLDTFMSTIMAPAGVGRRVQLLAKPSGLWVPPWQLVSALLKTPLRTATWWASPRINSTQRGFHPACWGDQLGLPDEVQVATSGHWGETYFGLQGGGAFADQNAGKLAHSIGGSLVVTGDLNQQGSLWPLQGHCAVAQNARGGLFFVLEDAVLHESVRQLLSGGTAPYVSYFHEKNPVSSDPTLLV